MPAFNEEYNIYDKNSNTEMFRLISFGKLYPDREYIVSKKEPTETVIEYVLSGVGYFECNQTVTTLEKGDCYIIPPGNSHSYYSDETQPYSKLWITVSGKYVDKWLNLYGIGSEPIFIRETDISPYYHQLHNIALGDFDFDNEKKLMLLIHNIIFEMGITKPKHSKIQLNQEHYIKTRDNVIHDIKKYIESQSNERLKIKDVATKFGISQNILNKMFVEKYGIHPREYHLKCKINSAAYFLEITDLSIDVISETVGFYDRSHFRKCFIKFYGVSPAQYKKQFHKNN